MLVNSLAALFPSHNATLGALFLAGASAGIASAISSRLIAQSPDPDTVAAHLGICGAVVLIIIGGTAAWAAQFGMIGLHATIAMAALIAAPAVLTLPMRPPARSDRKLSRHIDYRAVLLLIGVFIYATKDGIAWSLSQTIAVDLGFSANQQAILLAMIGLTGVMGAGLAVWCSKHYGWVIPSIMAILVNTILGVSQYMVSDSSSYAVLACAYTASHIFLIPFLLGLASWLDSNGRVVAAVSGLIIMGSAVGPMLGTQLLAVGGKELVAGAMFVATALAALLWLTPAARRFAARHSSPGQ